MRHSSRGAWERQEEAKRRGSAVAPAAQPGSQATLAPPAHPPWLNSRSSSNTRRHSTSPPSWSSSMACRGGAQAGGGEVGGWCGESSEQGVGRSSQGGGSPLWGPLWGLHPHPHPTPHPTCMSSSKRLSDLPPAWPTRKYASRAVRRSS